MSQRPQSGPQSTKPSFLPAASSNTQNETEVSPPITYRPRVSIQGFQPITNSDQVSIQEPLSIIHNHHVQDPPLVHGCWASTQDAPPIINSGWISTEDTPSTMNSHQLSIQDTSSVTYSHRFSTRDVPPISQNHHFSIQNSPLLSQETNIESLIYSGSQVISQDHLPTNQSPCSSTQCLISPIQAKVDASPSITHISTASIKSLDSTIWTSQESSKDTMDSFLGNPSTLDNNVQSIQSNRSAKMDSGRPSGLCLGLSHPRQHHQHLPLHLTPKHHLLHQLQHTHAGLLQRHPRDPDRFPFLSELHELLVHPGAPGHLNLGHRNNPTYGLLPLLPVKHLTALLSSSPPPLRVLPFSFPSQSPHSD
ncbi:uncharacterized protein LOC115280942 isoform X2 [Suricata suricatta]|uniref:uncharacterized protein LOC115280942 isoform X2 n=1 Tax=Suricata suricatta TaxID=37032 RepID=UPI001155D04C|nr:uncharacterized protein LOC115280942 isoform X2 [Suricata suricatta]